MRRFREALSSSTQRQGDAQDVPKSLAFLRPQPPDTAVPTENQTMLEAFEWYTPSEGTHWRLLQRIMPDLKRIGVDNMWIPPGCKAGWHESNGYDIYDLYDLGEFDQKGSRRTKWGNKEELVNMMKVAQSLHIGIYWDAVLNHKAAADYTEQAKAIEVQPKDRTREKGQIQQVEVWTGYDFPGRAGKYSSLKWNWTHFSGTNYNARTKSVDSIYKFVGPGKPGWAKDVDDEDGNADYLMFNDLDYSQKEVVQDTANWGVWIARELGLAGFRLDAVKHFSQSFLKSWIAHLDANLGRKTFMVGEYWRGDTSLLVKMIDKFEGRLHLFDVVLLGNFCDLSKTRNGDMRTILKGSLIERRPNQAVTFVINHDTQERIERDHNVSPVLPWFIPLAYSLILLRAGSGTPCIFFGDLYGTQGSKPNPPSCNGQLPTLTLVRKFYAYGPQKEYINDRNCIGFTRFGHGNFSRGAGVAVVMSNALTYRTKKMCVGEQHAGEEWSDVLRFLPGTVKIDAKGYGVFPVGPRSVSVYVDVNAAGREQIDHLRFDDNIYDPLGSSIGPTIVGQ